MKKIIFLFLIIISITKALPILQTGQTKSYDENGNEIVDSSLKDDGYYKAGVIRNYSRNDENEIVTDNVTNLMWQDNNEASTITKSWDEAVNYCNNLTLGNYEDWRLPNTKELASLVNIAYKYPALDDNFINRASKDYWSYNEVIDNTTYAWNIDFQYGFIVSYNEKSNNFYVRCVRGGEQYSSFSRDNSLEVVTDNIRNLMWQDNNDTNSIKMSWREAINYCENLEFANYFDWRLPNRNELLSITDKTRYEPAIDSNFINYPLKYYDSDYWSSTSYASKSYAWRVGFYKGVLLGDDKIKDYYVRCVRGGEININKSPTLTISADKTSINANETISFTSIANDSDGSIANYSWDFGDGTISTEANPTHSYTSVGTYNIICTVTDDSGASESQTISVAVNEIENIPPTLTISSDKTSININETISFTSSATDSDGSIASYSWDFGDGTISTEANPTHSYTSVGTYNIICTVTDDSGASESQSISVTINEIENIPPTLTISSDKTSVVTGERINFLLTATDSDGNIASYHWDFGDGHSASYRNPYNSYETAGEYNVTCSVKDDKGAITTKTILINVTERENLIPHLGISILKTSENANLYVNETISFRSTTYDSDGEIVSYSWDFGDGTTSTEANPTHIYTAVGTYNVSCTVTDNGGATKSQSFKIVIEEDTNVSINIADSGTESQKQFIRDDSLEVVIDEVNNLMWQDNITQVTRKDNVNLIFYSKVHLFGDLTDGKSYSHYVDWKNAIDYCENLKLAGFDDWSLPNIREYLTIIDSAKRSPSIKSAFKNNERYSNYWTSTSFFNGGRQVYYINLSYGNIDYIPIDSKAFVRCVRVAK